MKVSAVTVVAGRSAHLSAQRAGLERSRILVDEHVVVAMGGPDVLDAVVHTVTAAPGRATVVGVDVPISAAGARLPLARARNAGAATALAGGADLLVFLDVDCVPGEHLVARYRAAAALPGAEEALLCGPVTYLPRAPVDGYPWPEIAAWTRPHPARPAPADGTVVRGGRVELFWSLSFAVLAHSWRHVGGFCEDYAGYGGEDTDFAFRARAAGVDLWWVGGADAYHQHHPVSDPPVEHLEDILANAALFHRRWGEWPMTGWLDAFARRGLARHDPVTDRWVRTG